MGSLILSLSGCVYYKTLSVPEPSKIELALAMEAKSIVLLNNHFSTATYRLDSLTICDSIFSGYASFTPGLHDPNKNSFRKVDKEQKLTQIEPMITFHIILNTDTQIKEGYFEAELASIETINMHKKNPGKSAAIVLIPTGIFLIFIAIIASTVSFSIPLW
jgi:hypothetical protein